MLLQGLWPGTVLLAWKTNSVMWVIWIAVAKKSQKSNKLASVAGALYFGCQCIKVLYFWGKLEKRI